MVDLAQRFVSICTVNISALIHKKMKLNTFSLKLSISILFISTLCAGQQANVNLDYNPQKNTEGLIPFSAPLNSPDVHDDNTVTFRIKAPEGSTH
jgi:enterochelin esterase family protein